MILIVLIISGCTTVFTLDYYIIPEDYSKSFYYKNYSREEHGTDKYNSIKFYDSSGKYIGYSTQQKYMRTYFNEKKEVIGATRVTGNQIARYDGKGNFLGQIVIDTIKAREYDNQNNLLNKLEIDVKK